MMGVEVPVLPVAMDAAAPKGAPRRINDWPENFKLPCPAVPEERP